MAAEKVHPSELMEFVSISPTSNHIEHSKDASRNIDPRSSIGTAPTSSDGKRGSENPSRLNFSGFSADNFAASQMEHKMTLTEALRIYPKAVAWSAIISFVIVMEGYDTNLINPFFAFPEFENAYGVPDANGDRNISTHWQSSLSNISIVGSILGLFASGALTERFGYRHTIMGGLIMLAAFVFLAFFAFNIQTLLAYQALSGFPFGIFSTLTTAYAAEVMPLNLRGYLTGNVNLCWLLGQITSLGMLRALINFKSRWSFRIPYGLQWVWIVLIFFATYKAPESPWWLLRKGRKDEARKVLERLTRRHNNVNVDDILDIMENTDILEKKVEHKSEQDTKRFAFFDKTGYGLCFRGTNFRRTEIASMVFMIQNMCGLPIIGYAAYFYRQIGFSVIRSFDLTLGMQGLAILGQVLFIILLARFERRRTLFLGGLAVSFLVLGSVGIISSLQETQVTLWITAGLIVSFIFIFDASIGPLTYCIVAEIPSTRLRVKTLVLARVAYNVNSLVTNIIIQHMLNPEAWNWRGKAAYFCVVTCALSLVYCYFRLPETRGLSYYELDVLFEKKAPARTFGRFQKILENNGYFSFNEDRGR